MWADAQRDGCPAKYRWRPVAQCRKVWLMPTNRVSCSKAANIEGKTCTQSEFCTWQNSVRGKSSQKCIYSVQAQETAKHRAKFG